MYAQIIGKLFAQYVGILQTAQIIGKYFAQYIGSSIYPQIINRILLFSVQLDKMVGSNEARSKWPRKCGSQKKSPLCGGQSRFCPILFKRFMVWDSLKQKFRRSYFYGTSHCERSDHRTIPFSATFIKPRNFFDRKFCRGDR